MALFKVKSTRGGTPSKKNQHQADDKHASDNSTNKAGGSAYPSKPKKGRAGRNRIKHADRLSDALTGEKHACCIAPDIIRKNLKS